MMSGIARHFCLARAGVSCFPHNRVLWEERYLVSRGSGCARYYKYQGAVVNCSSIGNFCSVCSGPAGLARVVERLSLFRWKGCKRDSMIGASWLADAR